MGTEVMCAHLIPAHISRIDSELKHSLYNVDNIQELPITTFVERMF